VARVRDLYDGEIRYVDRELGRLLDALRASGELERTLVVVTADHGESLGEHRYWFEHGSYAYQATCRVPLIVRWPRGREGLLRGWVSAPVSLADVTPTVLELVGLPPLSSPTSPPHAGRSLLELCDPKRAAVSGGQGREPVVFLEKVERAELDRAVQIKAVRVGRWKLVRRYAHVTRAGARELAVLSDELYDLEADPLEARDLSTAPPPEAPLDELAARLLAFTAADRAFPELDLVLQRQRDSLAPEVRRTLEALGY
jgi:arylsulfatase A-like enzyme